MTDIWKFYDKVDGLIKKWARDGLSEFASKLKTAKASGCTSGEILGKIGAVLKEFKNQESDGTFDIEVKRLMEFVKNSLG